jgi:hypothetical protein
MNMQNMLKRESNNFIMMMKLSTLVIDSDAASFLFWMEYMRRSNKFL